MPHAECSRQPLLPTCSCTAPEGLLELVLRGGEEAWLWLQHLWPATPPCIRHVHKLRALLHVGALTQPIIPYDLQPRDAGNLGSSMVGADHRCCSIAEFVCGHAALAATWQLHICILLCMQLLSWCDWLCADHLWGCQCRGRQGPARTKQQPWGSCCSAHSLAPAPLGSHPIQSTLRRFQRSAPGPTHICSGCTATGCVVPQAPARL